MTTRLRKWAASTALVLTAGFALTACGGDDGGSDADPTPSASEEAEPAGDALSQDDFASTVSAAMIESGSVHVAMDLGAAGATGEGDIVVGDTIATSALSMTVNDVEVRLVDGIYYVNLGQVSGGMFLSVDPAGDGQFAQSFGPVLEQANPASQLKIFDAALTDFAVGDTGEEIDGVATTAYVLTLDPSKVLSEQQQAQTGGALPPTMEVTMYLGPDDLPRRVTTEVSGATVTIDYSAWGEPVEVTAPPADQVTDGAAFGF